MYDKTIAGSKSYSHNFYIKNFKEFEKKVKIYARYCV